VPLTAATHVEVCDVLIVDGLGATTIPVTAAAIGAGATIGATLIEAELDLELSAVEVAVQVPVPVVNGVNTPLAEIVPPVAVHVTFVL
jgi:hypothetical protein